MDNQKKGCDKSDRDSPCYINQEISHVTAGRDVTIKPTINFEYNDEIEMVGCDEIKTGLDGKAYGLGCRIQFRDSDVINKLLSKN